MSKALLDKLRKARELNVSVNGHTFTARRPTDAEVVSMPKDSAGLDFVRRFIVGWDVKELDVIPGGGPEVVPFDRELWAEWVDDKPEYWTPLANALLDAYRAHAAEVQDNEKNSQPGSTA